MPARLPERIVCLTEETVETLYLLGEQDRIVGISGFTVRPPEARRTKPKVSAFVSAKHERILALEPDLVLGFSDLQADIAAELVRRGANVYVANHRSVAGILDQILLLASMVGARDRGEALVARLEARVEAVRRAGEALAVRPRVYFEEWDEPMISAIGWVSEIVSIAGGEDVFEELSREPAGRDRIVADPGEVVARDPELIVGSWCGKKFRPEKVAARPGWDAISAVRAGRLHEIKSPEILQPGPAALTDGLDRMAALVTGAARELAAGGATDRATGTAPARDRRDRPGGRCNIVHDPRPPGASGTG